VGALRFDVTGRRLLAQRPRDSRLWDVERGTAVPLPSAIRRDLSIVWFGPDDDTLIVASDGGLNRVNIGTGKATRVTALDNFTQTTVSGDGRTAVSCRDDEFVRWDLVTLRERDRHAADPYRSCRPEIIDHSGRVLLTKVTGGTPNSRASLLNMDTGETAAPLVPGVSASGQSTGIGTGQSTRLVTGRGPALAVADVDASRFAPVDEERDKAVRPVFSRDMRLAAAGSSSRLRLWDTANGREIAHAANPEDEEPLRFGSDGRRLLTMSETAGRLYVRELPSLRVLAQAPLTPAPGVRPSGQSFSGLCAADTSAPDTIAVMHGGSISRIDLRTGTLRAPVRPYRDPSHLNRLAATGACTARPRSDQMAFDAGGDVELWDLERGVQVARLPVNSDSRINSLKFSANGRLLAILSADGALQVWNVDERRLVQPPLKTLEPGDASSGSVVFIDDDRSIIGGLGQVRIWDLARRSLSTDLELGSSVITPTISQDRGTLLVWLDGVLARIPLNPERWAEHLCQVVGRDLTPAERKSLPPGSTTERICPPA
jgi:WD40 repeat protein